MTASFNEQFGQYGAWRRGFASQLQELREWLMAQDLLDTSVQERLQRLEDQMRSDKVMVAFVAEFSRGKSELINAIFFAHYGRRLMPASAGRTTMCPAELGWESEFAPSLRLLPIDTRESHESLAQWRMRSEAWAQYPLDIGDAQQIADTLAKVTAVRKVSVDQARALGFWHDDEEADNPMVDADGWVEVPMWRHALINMPHPLLKQGLVILDTPGLNAVGAEPELTVNLIPQAHAVVFVLGADTGVTKSDLAIWRNHVLPAGTGNAGANDALVASRLVVLNKVDTLWDSLSSGAQVQAQLRRQQQDSANLLGVSADKVLPVSAQKGLVAKVSRNEALLQASGLPAFEDLLANGIMGQRQKVLQTAAFASVQQLQWQVERVINMRRSELDDQLAELCGLRGKNTNVIAGMRSRIEGESNEFDQSAAKINAMRVEHLRMLKDIFQLLSSTALKSELAQLKQALDQRGLKLGVRKVYEQTFERLHAVAVNVLAQADEMQKQMSTTFKELNAEFGFSLQVPPGLLFSDFTQDLSSIEGSYTQYIGLSSAFKLSKADFSQRLIKALALRLRTVFEAASSDVEMWSKSLTAPVDAQLRERKRSYTRRLEAVDRISGATTELEERIADMENAQDQLGVVQTQLASVSSKLMVPIEGERAKSASPALDINLVV